MQSSIINAARLISETESPTADITEALPSGVVTVRELREVARVLESQGFTAGE
jgi:hypothetical protein